MTDTDSTSPAAADPALDQAMDWLIRLPCADDSERQAFEAWRSADPRHAAAFDRLNAMWNSTAVREVAAQPATQAPPAPPIQIPQPRRRRRWPLRQLATACALVLGVALYCDVPIRLEADHLTRVGERQHLELDDGSRVLLGTHTAFSSDIDATHRSARLLQGQAYFELDDKRSLPLEILAGPLRATAHDGAFAVSFLDGRARVDVQRGNMDLQPNAHERLRLKAGDSVSVGPDGIGQRTALNPARDLAWVHNRLVFENCPLSQVIAEVRRYYPGWIVNRNPHLDQVAVTGNYRLDEPVEVLRSLAHITSAKLTEFPALVILN